MIYNIKFKIISILFYLIISDICFSNSDTLRILNYNIYGLSTFYTILFPNNVLNQSKDRINSIFEESNKYDIVFFQENWNYQNLLREVMKNHKLIIAEKTNFIIKNNPKRSSGLNFAISKKINVDDVDENLYTECNGYFTNYNDCLVSKGFIYSLISTFNYKINLYVTHLDAGYSNKDILTRKKQLKELSNHIKRINNNYPLIICGDFNIDYYNDYNVINEFIETNRLNILRWDEVVEIEEMIDYVFYRSSNENNINIIDYGINSSLLNKSDHYPIELVVKVEENY